MSTRCQVHVVCEGVGWTEACTLYHHFDGYPSNIVPLIAKAFELSGKGWEAGRAGKAASFLCAADPGGFEPEEGHELHGDIEFYYVVHLVNKHHGCVGDKPAWEVEVLVPTEGFWKNGLEAQCTVADLKPLRKRQPLASLMRWVADEEAKRAAERDRKAAAQPA